MLVYRSKKLEDLSSYPKTKLLHLFNEKVFEMESKENKSDISSLFLIKMLILYVIIMIGFANKSKLLGTFSDGSSKNVASIHSGRHNFKKINTDQTAFFK